MKKISVTDLAGITKANFLSRETGGENPITGVSTDSRSLTRGDCFFAISGPNFDGHNYIAEAFTKGASCAVVSNAVSISNQQSTIGNNIILKVPDTVRALGDLAAWYRRDRKFKVLAITGSAGKTTTRQIVHQVLSQKFKTSQSLKNFNNFIGLPLSILAAPPDCRVLVLELATSHPGEIEYLSKIASPDIALVTNVHPAHLAGFGCVEKIAVEKLSVSKGLAPDGVLIINADCPALLEAAGRLSSPFKSFSITPLSDFPARNFILGPLAVAFTVDLTNITLPIPGRGALENALAAWAICSTLDVCPDDFASAVKDFNQVSMRNEILQIGSLTVINDCYNANPASMKNAIDVLSRLASAQKRRPVFICGDMAELGDTEQTFHIDLGRQIAEAGVSVLLTVGPLAELAALAARQAKTGILTQSYASTDDLCGGLSGHIRDGDIILIKGSRVNKLESVVEKLKRLIPTS